jgi:hypothetical protein
MPSLPPLRHVGAWGLLLLAASPARADRISYTQWTQTDTPTVWADSPGQSRVVVTNPVRDPGPIHVLDFEGFLTAFSDAPDGRPDHFTHRPWDLLVFVRDGASGAVGHVRFTAELNGTLSRHTSALTSTLTSADTQVLDLKGHLYTFRVAVHVAPPAPGFGRGALGGYTAVRHNPEPSGLVLVALGGPLLGLRLWRWRRARPRG